MTAGSIRRRLITGTTIGLIIALIIGGFVLSSVFRRSVESAFVERLQSLLLAVVAAIEVGPEGKLQIVREIPNPLFDRVYSGWYWQVVDGESHVGSRSLWDATLPVWIGASEVAQVNRMIQGPRDQPLRVVAQRLQFPSRPQPVIVVVAGPEEELRHEINSFDRLLVLSLAVMALTLIAAVAVQVSYGLLPFRNLALELDDIRHGHGTRLSDGYPEEIQPLVQTMNDVLDQDARRIERARALAGNLAHGLKTPLSVLTVEAARAAPDAGRIAAQVSRMTRVVDHHLARAAAVGSQQAIGINTEIAPVVAELRSMLLRIHAERQLAIESDVAAGLSFAGERQDLEEMLGNLIDNACKWARSRVVIRGQHVPAAIEITVDDDGQGLPAGEADSAMKRGVRLDETEPGTGLGLAITTDLARLYGGTLDLGASHLGGLKATLRLPT